MMNAQMEIPVIAQLLYPCLVSNTLEKILATKMIGCLLRTVRSGGYGIANITWNILE
jgi:hypothetical protein